MSARRRLPYPATDQDMLRCIVDEAGNMLYATPALCWAVGSSAASLVGRPIEAWIKPLHPEKNRESPFSFSSAGFCDLALIRDDRDPLVVSAWLDHIDASSGEKLTVIWLDPEDRLRHFAANEDMGQAAAEFAEIISENLKKEQRENSAAALRRELGQISKSDGELRNFMNLSNDLFGIYRRDMSFVRVNFSFNRVLGYADADLQHLPFIDLIHPEDRDEVMAQMTKILQAPPEQETRADFECRVCCKDGSVRWIEWIHKTFGEHIYIVGRDVTAFKQHEMELHRREQQLSEAQAVGRMGNWHWDAMQNKLEWSEQIYAIFGVEKGQFLPSIDGVRSFLFKRDLGRISRVFQLAMIRRRDYEVEFSVRRPAGGVRYVRCEGRCKVNPKTGHVEALFGIMQDVTERTLHERALREAKEAAESAYASKTRFLANMSHELRTPLNAIIGFSEMMQHQLLGPVGNARYLDYIAGIRQSGEHLLDLINDILDMSKIEVGKYELYVEDLNIGKVIRLAIHMVEGRAHESQVRLVADDIPDDLHIMADRRAIMQILLNIMSNAVKFTRPGGTVDIRCHAELGGIAVVVADTGIGIPKEKLDLVTMPFEQVSGEFTRNHEGTGLGLAITKDLVELHGGTLDIDSDVGVGTIVTILLPDKVPEVRHNRRDEAADDIVASPARMA